MPSSMAAALRRRARTGMGFINFETILPEFIVGCWFCNLKLNINDPAHRRHRNLWRRIHNYLIYLTISPVDVIRKTTLRNADFFVLSTSMNAMRCALGWPRQPHWNERVQTETFPKMKRKRRNGKEKPSKMLAKVFRLCPWTKQVYNCTKGAPRTNTNFSILFAYLL